MNILKALFGNSSQTPEEEKQSEADRQFDLLKYDGVKAMKTGQAAYAVKYFQEALRRREDLEVRDYLSRVLAAQGEYAQAIEQLRLLIEAQPDNGALPLQAARVAELMDDYQLMSQFCEQALAVDADSPQAHLFLARACQGQNDWVGAVAQLTKCLAVDDKVGDARLLRGQLLLQMGDVAGAAADVEWLREHAEQHEDVLLLAARIAAAKGLADEAIDLYGQVIELNPFQVEAYRERGKLRLDKGDKQGAQEDMEKVLELSPAEMEGITGDYTAEGIEQQVRRAYSAVNPFGL